MKADIYDSKGKKTEKKVDLNDQIWTLPYNEDLVAQAVYVYRNNERAGTANAKGKGEVSGGGRKPWRQKGTGRARHGSNRSPLWVGGGVHFSPSGRNWSRRLGKKMRNKALMVMLSKRLKNEDLAIYDFGKAVERELFEGQKSALLVTDNKETYTKVRNIPTLKTVSSKDINALDVVSGAKVYFDSESIANLEERLSDGK